MKDAKFKEFTYNDKQQILEYLKFRTCGMTFTIYEEGWKKLQEWRHQREKEFSKNSRDFNF